MAAAGARFSRRSLVARTCHGVPEHAMPKKSASHKKTRRCRRVFSSLDQIRLRLRLGLETRVRIGTRARLAGRRHGRGTRGGRLQHRLAVRLLALEQILNLVAREGLEFKQALGEGLEVFALLGKNPRRFVIALFDKAADLGIDLL